MLYASTAKKVLITHDEPGIQAVDSPTDFSHAPRYEVAPVMAHKRPRREKLYAAMAPIVAIRIAAGMAALGASPKAAIPKVVSEV